MTPAQRLAEWLDQGDTRQCEAWFSVGTRLWRCDLQDGLRSEHAKSVASRNEAITAALDAWQKGDG